jgi:hypothetical protein
MWRIALLGLTYASLSLLQARDNAAPTSYYWRSSPAGESAQLLTLFCRAC